MTQNCNNSLGAYAFLESVYFRAFAVNVKTIALGKYLYQFGHAIWCGAAPNVVLTLMDALNLSGRYAAVFTTSGATKPMKLAIKLKKLYPEVRWHEPLNANSVTEEEIRNWM